MFVRLNTFMNNNKQRSYRWIKQKFPWLFILHHVKLVTKGYQSYLYTKYEIFPGNNYIRVRQNLIDAKLRLIVPGKTVLDLGCAQGYFSIYSGKLGARNVLGIDRDLNAINTARKVVKHMGMTNVRFKNMSIFDIDSKTQYDVLFAFAIVHWFPHEVDRPYFDGYKPIVEWISQRGRRVFIEFISIDDRTVQQPWWGEAKHEEFQERVRKNFTRDKFLMALNDSFETVEFLGKTSETRELYFAESGVT